MSEDRYSKPSELLADLHSHGIYGASVLDDCDFDTSMIPTRTAEATAASVNARGLGGEFTPSDTEGGYFTGWQAADALARASFGKTPGSRYHGRGAAFRANVSALTEAGL